MSTRNLTCIGCPMGCQLTAELAGGEVVSVRGNTCARGEAYARKECTHPARTVTGTVRYEVGVDDGAAVCRVYPRDQLTDVQNISTQQKHHAPLGAQRRGQLLRRLDCGNHGRIFQCRDECMAHWATLRFSGRIKYRTTI